MQGQSMVAPTEHHWMNLIQAVLFWSSEPEEDANLPGFQGICLFKFLTFCHKTLLQNLIHAWLSCCENFSGVMRRPVDLMRKTYKGDEEHQDVAVTENT